MDRRSLGNDDVGSAVANYDDRDYREYWESVHRFILHEQETRILRELLPRQPGWFIDVGAAHGRLSPVYAQPDRHCVLVDYSIRHLEYAAEQYSGPNFHFVAADAYHLPFKSGVFSSGLAVRVFHHMHMPDAFLSEMSRVMEAGARVVVEYSNKRNALRILRRGRSAFRHDHEPYPGRLLFGTHPRHFERLALNASLEPLRVRGTGVLDQLVRVSMRLRRPARIVDEVATRTLGPRSLAPATFVELRKQGRAPESVKHSLTLSDIIACPICGGSLEPFGNDTQAGSVSCVSANHRFSRRGPILDLRPDVAA